MSTLGFDAGKQEFAKATANHLIQMLGKEVITLNGETEEEKENLYRAMVPQHAEVVNANVRVELSISGLVEELVTFGYDGGEPSDNVFIPAMQSLQIMPNDGVEIRTKLSEYLREWPY